MEHEFWLVVNLESSHWLMKDAIKTYSLDEATRKATDLAEKYPRQTYHILHVIRKVRAKRTPVETIDLVKRNYPDIFKDTPEYSDGRASAKP